MENTFNNITNYITEGDILTDIQKKSEIMPEAIGNQIYRKMDISENALSLSSRMKQEVILQSMKTKLPVLSSFIDYNRTSINKGIAAHCTY